MFIRHDEVAFVLCPLDNAEYVSHWGSLFSLAARKLKANLELTCRIFHNLGFLQGLFFYLPLLLHSHFTFYCV